MTAQANDLENANSTTMQDEKYRDWAWGRIVVVRPDVPGKKYDEADTILLHSDAERVAAQTALMQHFEDVQTRQDGVPGWFSHLVEIEADN